MCSKPTKQDRIEAAWALDSAQQRIRDRRFYSPGDSADQVDHLEFTRSVWRSAEARLDGRDFPLPGQLS
jgi:hypothetical protein